MEVAKPIAQTPEACADLTVSAGRMFSAALRVGRAAGLPRAQAIRTANDFVARHLRFDWCNELGIAAEIEELAPRSEANTISGLLSSNVGSFMEQLLAGSLSPLRLAPGLTSDWYAAYRAWCSGRQDAPVSLKRFVMEVSRNHRWHPTRKRFMDDMGALTHPRSMFLFGQSAPASEVELQWLSDQLGTTKRMLASAGVRAH